MQEVYVTCKTNCIVVKLTVCYTVSFTCNIYFLNSTYFIFNEFKSSKFSRFFYCWVYIFNFGALSVNYDTYFQIPLLLLGNISGYLEGI